MSCISLKTLKWLAFCKAFINICNLHESTSYIFAPVDLHDPEDAEGSEFQTLFLMC